MPKLPYLLNIGQRYNKNLIRGGITFFDDFLVYFLKKKPSRGPFFISWNITYKCNSKCIHCDAWKRGLEKKKREMTTEQCLDIIRQAGKAGVWTISFTGGEPLIRPDIELLIKEAKKQKMNVNINTNGLLLMNKAEMLIKNKVDIIVVSVDSHKPEVHDSIRRIPGTFKKLEKGILKVRNLRKQKKPFITIRNVITKRNFTELDDFIKYWKNKVDSISFQPVHHGLTTSIHNVDKTDILFLPKDKKKFIENFKKLQEKYAWLRNTYYNKFPDFFFNKTSLYKEFKCYVGFFNLKIDPYGNCFTCAHMVYKIGNLINERLMDIWRGEKINTFRKIVKQKRNQCICWTNNSLVNTYMSKVFGGK